MFPFLYYKLLVSNKRWHTGTNMTITAASLTIARNASSTMPAWSRTVYNGAHIAGERNDCAVRALMTVTGATYIAAHNTLRTLCGRAHGRGTPAMPLMGLLDGRDVLGCKFERIVGDSGQYLRAGRNGTLAAFLASNPVGVFFVWKHGHAFAIVDGVLVDTWHVGKRSRVCAAWRVTGKPAARKPAARKPRGSKYTALLQNVIAQHAVDGVARVPFADLMAMGFAMSTTKYSADWGTTMPCGKAAQALGLKGRILKGEGVVVITAA